MNLNSPKKEPSASRVFIKHFARNLVIGFILTVVIILIGMVGCHLIEKNSWLDSYVNCAMIISGVGTLVNPVTKEGKLFIATYSLFGGGSFLLILGVIFSPIFHWMGRQIKVEDREHFK